MRIDVIMNKKSKVENSFLTSLNTGNPRGKRQTFQFFLREGARNKNT